MAAVVRINEPIATLTEGDREDIILLMREADGHLAECLPDIVISEGLEEFMLHELASAASKLKTALRNLEGRVERYEGGGRE